MRQNRFGSAPLLRAAEELFAQLMRYDEEEEIDFGLIRVSAPRVPEVTARELIGNALVHHDYPVRGRSPSS